MEETGQGLLNYEEEVKEDLLKVLDKLPKQDEVLRSQINDIINNLNDKASFRRAYNL